MRTEPCYTGSTVLQLSTETAIAMLQPYQQKIISLFGEQKFHISELYRILADRYPAHRELWLSLHREKLEHARLIEAFSRNISAGTMAFREDQMKTYTVQAFIDYLKASTEKAGSGLSLKEAVSLAKGIEDSLIERQLFSHFKGGSPETVSALQRMERETTRHRQRIETLWVIVKETR